MAKLRRLPYGQREARLPSGAGKWPLSRCGVASGRPVSGVAPSPKGVAKGRPRSRCGVASGQSVAGWAIAFWPRSGASLWVWPE